MAIEVPQNKELSGGGKNGGGEAVVFTICRRKANRGSINIKEKIKEELFGEMLTPT